MADKGEFSITSHLLFGLEATDKTKTRSPKALRSPRQKIAIIEQKPLNNFIQDDKKLMDPSHILIHLNSIVQIHAYQPLISHKFIAYCSFP